MSFPYIYLMSMSSLPCSIYSCDFFSHFYTSSCSCKPFLSHRLNECASSGSSSITARRSLRVSCPKPVEIILTTY